MEPQTRCILNDSIVSGRFYIVRAHFRAIPEAVFLCPHCAQSWAKHAPWLDVLSVQIDIHTLSKLVKELDRIVTIQSPQNSSALGALDEPKRRE